MKKNLEALFHDIRTFNTVLENDTILKGLRTRSLGQCEEIEFGEREAMAREIINNLEKKIIPNEYPKFMINSSEFMMLRGAIIERQGFALVSKKWVEPLAKWIGNKKCLEIMCGCGSISYALQQQGVNVIATDNFSWNGMDSWNTKKNYWTDIENIDCIEAIRKYGKDIDVIILSWAYMDNYAYQSLIEMRKVNPGTVMLVIGEGVGGCTADDDFFETMEVIDNKEIDHIDAKYDTWSGLYDHIMLVK